MVDNGFVGESLGLGENDYGNSGLFFAWFLEPKIKYCLVIDDYGVISAKRTFKGYSEEHRKMKLDQYISLSKGKTASCRFSIDSTKTFEGIRITHKKQNCSYCVNGKVCSGCVLKPKMICFNCEKERACKRCLDLTSQKKTYSTDKNMLKRKPPNEYHQVLPQNEGVFKPKQNIIDFRPAREISTEEHYRKVVKRRFERVNNMMECKSCIKNEDIPENKKDNCLRIQT